MKPIVFILSIFLLVSCDSDYNSANEIQENQVQSFALLSLGDSYTKGEGVCDHCKFPEQLKDSLANQLENSELELNVIAQTGWTTTNLINAITEANLSQDYDLVTLLIGVNNQFQNKPFELYEEEFPQLVSTAIQAAKGDASRIIVLSIPDYAFTPFGQSQNNPNNISTELDQYNAFAKNYCEQQNIIFLNITDITRQGLDNLGLIASDGLHPSTLAYSRFVERLIPLVLPILEE